MYIVVTPIHAVKDITKTPAKSPGEDAVEQRIDAAAQVEANA